MHALKGVHMEARCGELLMIVGPSGCGKTTLLSLIAGTLRTDAGDLEVFGSNLGKMSSGKLCKFRRETVGFIFQQFNLVPQWTAVENASVPLLLAGKGRAEAEKEAARLLTEMKLADRLKAHPKQLSGGQQQRVAIARALVHSPRLLIADEPTASLDAETGRRVMELLRESACRPDRCVIVVTHDSRVFQFADRIAEMEDGVVKGMHQSDAFQAHYF